MRTADASRTNREGWRGDGWVYSTYVRGLFLAALSEPSRSRLFHLPPGCSQQPGSLRRLAFTVLSLRKRAAGLLQNKRCDGHLLP